MNEALSNRLNRMNRARNLRWVHLNDGTGEGGGDNGAGDSADQDTLLTGSADNTNDGGSEAQGNEDSKDGTLLTGDDSSDKDGDASTDGADDTDAGEGAPESYEQFNVPEGLSLEGERLESFTNYAKSMNMTQQQAQEAIDMHTSIINQMIQENVSAVQAEQKEWIKATQNDSEYGGAKLKENLAMGRRALETYGSPELTKLLNQTGLGNHPEVNRLFINIGKTLSEDNSLVDGVLRTSDDKSLESRMYPNESKS